MSNDDGNEFAKAIGATVVGATVGYEIVAAAGFSAVGMIGSGAGIGAPAGPVGIVIGALVGLAGYGVYRLKR